MKVYVKNKLISLRGGSTVTNESGETAFVVQGKTFTVTRKKFIKDRDYNELYVVRNRYWNFFRHKAFIYKNGKKLATVSGAFFNGNRFIITGLKDEIVVDGKFFALSCNILRNGSVIGTIRRKITLVRDAFELEGDEQDMPFLVALVIAIDNITDDRRNSSN